MNIHEKWPLTASDDTLLAFRLASAPLLRENGLSVFLHPRDAAIQPAEVCGQQRDDGNPTTRTLWHEPGRRPFSKVVLAICRGSGRNRRVLLVVEWALKTNRPEVETFDDPVRRLRVPFDAFLGRDIDGKNGADLVFNAVLEQLGLVLERVRTDGRQPGLSLDLKSIQPRSALYSSLVAEHALVPVDPDRLPDEFTKRVKGCDETGLTAIPTPCGDRCGLCLGVCCDKRGRLIFAPFATQEDWSRACRPVTLPTLRGVQSLKQRIACLNSSSGIDRDRGSLARRMADMPLIDLFKGNDGELQRMRQLLMPRTAETVGEAAQAIRDACVATGVRLDARLIDALEQLTMLLMRMQRGGTPHE